MSKFLKLFAISISILLTACQSSKSTQTPNTQAPKAKDLLTRSFHFDSKCLNDLKDSQKPKVLVIGCSDSRVDPALLTGSLPGEIFVLRNIANLIPPYSSEQNGTASTGAVLEYAVKSLKVNDIVLLGHSNCGGIKALIGRQESKPTGEFLDPWLDLAQDLKESLKKEHSHCSKTQLCKIAEQSSLKNSAKNLLSYPWLKSRVDAGNLEIHLWYFDIEKGEISIIED